MRSRVQRGEPCSHLLRHSPSGMWKMNSGWGDFCCAGLEDYTVGWERYRMRELLSGKHKLSGGLGKGSDSHRCWDLGFMSTTRRKVPLYVAPRANLRLQHADQQVCTQTWCSCTLIIHHLLPQGQNLVRVYGYIYIICCPFICVCGFLALIWVPSTSQTQIFIFFFSQDLGIEMRRVSSWKTGARGSVVLKSVLKSVLIAKRKLIHFISCYTHKLQNIILDKSKVGC